MLAYSLSVHGLEHRSRTDGNRRVPVIEVTVDELRTVLSVAEGKLTRWVDLNRFAIEPALRQINDNPTASGFSVEVETISKGRKIESVRFKVTKAAERVLDDAEIKLRISHREAEQKKRPSVRLVRSIRSTPP